LGGCVEVDEDWAVIDAHLEERKNGVGVGTLDCEVNVIFVGSLTHLGSELETDLGGSLQGLDCATFIIGLEDC